MTKKSLAIYLSGLEVFEKPDIKLEQYPTDSEIASSILWHAYMLGDIEGKRIVDLGAGTGILGIGAIFLGAKHVVFVETDEMAVKILKENLADMNNCETDMNKYKIVQDDALKYTLKADLVIQNPPFGTRQKHLDKEFLEHAMTLSPVVYSFHKTATLDYIKKLCAKNKFSITEEWDFNFPLRKTYSHQTKKIERVKVSCLRIVIGA